LPSNIYKEFYIHFEKHTNLLLQISREQKSSNSTGQIPDKLPEMSRNFTKTLGYFTSKYFKLETVKENVMFSNFFNENDSAVNKLVLKVLFFPITSSG
jgi:hypothetical protein